MQSVLVFPQISRQIVGVKKSIGLVNYVKAMVLNWIRGYQIVLITYLRALPCMDVARIE